MLQAKIGDRVTVHYTGRLMDGSVFDSTIGEDPLVFTLGQDDIIDGFEEGVMSMLVGEKKTITLPPDKAYGERNEDMIMIVPLSDMPSDLEMEVGDELEVTDDNGEQMLLIVAEMHEDSVVLDGNPPLAGETLIFDLELVRIN